MAEAVGLSIGATRFAGVQLGRAAMTRRSVLTIQGVVVTGFVERVGDPVGMVTADGSIYRGEFLVADALRELLYTVTDGHPPATPPTVTYPAHWPRATVDALRTALTHVPEWSRARQPITVISDAAAAVSALQSEPGVPARGVIALCDFGGTGTSITLVDASRGYAPLGPTVRHADFSGDLIDQALLTHVIGDLAPAVGVDATGTSALGPLHRLRGQCASAKERLSSATVTALTAELPGFRGDVRLTRAELELQIRRPLAEFVGVLQDTLGRSGVRPADLVAVASAGGGARIPLVTTTLSERFRVPVITTPRPELAAASGAALRAAWGPADDRSTAIAPAFADADAESSTFRALAWSEAHDVPPVAPPLESMDDDPRPQLEFVAAETPLGTDPPPWYRRSSTLVGVAVSVALLLATSAVVAFANSSSPASSTAPLTPSTTAQAPGVAAPPVENTPAQDAPLRTVYANPAPVTQYQPPAQQPAAAPAPEQPAPAPSSEVPPPPPPGTTTLTTTTQAPTFTTTVTATPSPTTQPPVSQTPTQTPAPPSSTQPPVTVTIPQIPSIPGVLSPPHSP
jgi:hypothetical protein